MKNDPSAIKSEPLTPFMGARISGVDAGAPMDAKVKQRLREEWWKHGLLVLSDQSLDEDQQRAFGRIFGEISSDGEYGDQHYVSNVAPGGLVPHGELAFHVDHSWSERPLRGIMLHAIEVPPAGAGGETLFADVKRAYELLDPALRDRIDRLEIVHTYPDQTKHIPIPGPDPRPGMPTATHPLAFPHPITGKKMIFCSPRHFDRIPGLTPEAGLALAEQLAGHISRPEIGYKHVWRPGDLAVWDNLRLQHARTNFDRQYRRHLRRTQIGEPLGQAA